LYKNLYFSFVIKILKYLICFSLFSF